MAHPDASWQLEALCAEMGNEPFFSEFSWDVSAAKLICSQCPVHDECLEFAIRHPRTKGIWGGTTEAERYDLKLERGWYRNGSGGVPPSLL